MQGLSLMVVALAGVSIGITDGGIIDFNNIWYFARK